MSLADVSFQDGQAHQMVMSHQFGVKSAAKYKKYSEPVGIVKVFFMQPQ